MGGVLLSQSCHGICGGESEGPFRKPVLFFFDPDALFPFRETISSNLENHFSTTCGIKSYGTNT